MINHALLGRHDDRNLIHVRSLIVLLLRSLRKLERVEKHTLYRGISIETSELLNEGKEMVFWGFTSTSTKRLLFR